LPHLTSQKPEIRNQLRARNRQFLDAGTAAIRVLQAVEAGPNFLMQ
jgi:hypothetical protein